MKWVDNIFSFVGDISDWFYNAYLETKDWLIVGPLFSTILFGISGIFWDLLTPISHFGDWVYAVWSNVQDILTSEGVLGLIKAWFPWLESIGVWFANAYLNITSIITIWWGAVSSTVQGWITIATEGLAELIVAWDNFWTVTWPAWVASFEALLASWEDFKTNILPTLFDLETAFAWWKDRLPEVDDLIVSKLKEWFPFYNTLVEIWYEVVSFFSNPLDYLLDKFTDWFLGPEE